MSADRDRPATGDTTELELKLEVSSEDVRRLLRASWLKEVQEGRASRRSLNATYFDTDDELLRRNGLALRVRKEGRRWIQTLKASGGSSGAFARGEWECPVPGPAIDAGALVATPAARLLDGALERLEPRFETRVKRTVRRLKTETGTEVSWDFDDGEIVAGERHEPIHELELELKDGDPAGLFDLARRVVETVPVRLGARSKSDRGYALASGDGPRWKKAGKVDIAPGATVEEVLRRSVESCIDQMLANEDCVRSDCHIEGVHQFRVALRRLRSTIALYRDLLPAEQVDSLAPRIKALAASFGPARDWDVFLDEILVPVRTWFVDDDTLAEVERQARTRRDAAYVQAQEALDSPNYAALLIDLAAWLHTRGWRNQALSESAARFFSDARTLAAPVLERRHKKLRKAGRHIKRMSVDERHQLRITVKKARYAAEFFAGLYPGKKARRYVRALARLQDDLGLLNDVAVAEGLLQSLVAEGGGEERLCRGAGLVVGWYGRGLSDHFDDLIEEWKDFAASQPYWRAKGE